jgi:hypothetical protein
MAPAQKLDLFKEFKDEYVMPRKPVLIKTRKGKYLAVTGQGRPGGEEFQSCIQALFTAAWTIKMTRKFAGCDYKVCALEGLYEAGDTGMDFSSTPMEQWRWTLMIRVPEFIGKPDLKDAAAQAAKKGKTVDMGKVELRTISEGKCVQMLHVGPYDAERESIEKIKEFAAEQGLQLTGTHHEIYLSDPRRVAPERLRTILRIPVTKAK